MPTRLTQKEGSSLVTFIIIVLVIQLGLIGYVVYHEWKARNLVVTAARAACELNKDDRKDVVTLSQNIAKIFQSSQRDVKQINSSDRSIALSKIEGTTNELKGRSKINCDDAFPTSGFFP